jgi:hypothetical protein
MHAWDQPAEVLLERAPKMGAQLVMPRLGEPVEPAYAEAVAPWWRSVDASARDSVVKVPVASALPTAMSWPID